MKTRACELCTETAALYCASDSAFLCRTCDEKVHGANFLVARHVRQPLCSKCEGFVWNCISGAVIPPFAMVCRSCSSESQDDDTDSLSSSVCVSSTESFATSPKKFDSDREKIEVTSPSSVVTGITAEYSVPVNFSDRKRKTLTRSRAPAKVDGKTEGVLVNWCRMLGLNGKLSARVASHAFGLGLAVFEVLPFRVTLAAAFWFSLKLCGDGAASTCQNLKRIEEISGVPAKLIVAAERRLARCLRDRKTRRDQEEEGWDECSV